MRFRIVAEDNKKGKIEIPLTHRDIHNLFDLQFMICHDCIKTLKLNKADKTFWKFGKNMEFLCCDVLGDGEWFSKNKKGKFVLSKERHFLIKKPHWKK